MHSFRNKAAAVAAAVAIAFGVGGVAGSAPVGGLASPEIAIAKSCSSGYKHAKIGGAHKCLRAGQYCAKRYDRQYHRYGFHCHGKRLKKK
jgi:hypothetical protein